MKLLLALIILITSLVLAITAKASIYINQEVDSNLEKETSLKSEYFDIHKEFFIIDTNNLNSIKSKLYGYIIQENGIIENENIEHLDNHNISRCGAYVYIERDDDLITIKQDFNGSYGLFFFQMKNYYALSNSFFYLLDYIKNKFSLEYNEDYINFLLIQGLCSESCSETPIKNIKLLDKDSVVKINITTSIIDIKNFDFKINQYSISSEEGIKILDMWFHKWTKLYRSLYQNTNNIVITLSGGMDSRVTFLLAKRSGINLNEIKVYSINDTLHTHAEDYQIASEIAKYFGFKLNYDNNLAKDSVKFSLKDNINIYIYNKLPFHKEMRCKYKKLKYKRYTFTGSGGENIRLHWNFTAKERTEHYLKVAKRYNNIISEKLKKSIKKIAKSNYDFIKSKYQVENSESKDITRFLYMDSRSRHHSGRESVDDYFTNNYVLSPLLDPSLLQIKLSTEDCHDNNLLLALIFIRYCPQLLNFKFEGNRFISKSTIDYAIKINKLYPYKFQDIDFNNNFSIITEDKNIFVQNNSKSIVNTTIVNNFFKKLLESSKIKNLISEKFDKEIVNFAQKSSVVTNFYPLGEIYPLISTALVLHSIKHENLDNKSNYDWLNKEISMVNEATMKKRELELKVDIFSDFLTSYRLDIKNFGKKNNGLEIKAKNGRIKKAKWFSDFQGEGKIVQGDSMANIIKIKAINNGILRVYFRGQDKKYNTKRIPVWVDYKSIKIDKKEILDHPISTWHDEPFKYEISVKDGQEITIEFEQQYHHYTKDELKDVLLKLNKTSVSLEEIMISLYDKFNKGSNH